MSEKMSGSDYSWLQHVAIVDDDGWSIRGTEEQLDEIMRLARLGAQSQPDYAKGYEDGLEAAAKECDRIAGNAVDFVGRYTRKGAGACALTIRTLKSRQVCDFCHGTGQHLSPESAKPITVPCEKKGCTARQDHKCPGCGWVGPWGAVHPCPSLDGQRGEKAHEDKQS